MIGKEAMLSVSTKTGDQGMSGLANGQRVGKDQPIFDVLGTQDELNSWLGVCITKLADQFQDQREFLFNVQDTLFYIGAELAQSPKAKLTAEPLELLEKHSEDLQSKMGEGWTTKFFYPGGSEVASWLDVTRTVSRRLEREVAKYAQSAEVAPVILKYVNRLSDYLFVLRCFVNSRVQYQERKFLAKK